MQNVKLHSIDFQPLQCTTASLPLQRNFVDCGVVVCFVNKYTTVTYCIFPKSSKAEFGGIFIPPYPGREFANSLECMAHSHDL